MEKHFWFECSVGIDQRQEDGTTKSVTQKYLVDALSFTEAEERIIEEMKPFTCGGIDVSAVKKVNITELFENTADIADTWFRLKCVSIEVDEKTGEDKEKPFVVMVQSSCCYNSIQDFEEKMKESMMDYRIVEVKETKILDVYKYKG